MSQRHAHLLSYNKEFDVERALTAMIVCGDVDEAVRMLDAEQISCDATMLKNIREAHREQYEKRREEIAPQLEGIFANDLLDNARKASLIVNLAMQRTREMLEKGQVRDPAKVARDLSQVVAQSVDKRLAVQGRPTQITEHRDVGEIVRALQAMKVIEVIDASSTEEPDADE